MRDIHCPSESELLAFDLRLYSEGVPVLAGKCDVFEKAHPKMEKTILSQYLTADYQGKESFAVETGEPCFDQLYSAALESVRRAHHQVFKKDLVVSTNNRRTCLAYVANDKRPPVTLWHSHAMRATYNTVYYVKTNPGDAIRVIIPSDLRRCREGRELEIPVCESMLVVMPGWLYHTPKENLQLDGSPRIAINMEINSEGTTAPELLGYWSRPQSFRR